MGISALTGRMRRFMPTPLPPILLAAGPSGLWVVGGALLDGPVVLYRYDREGRVQLGQQDFPAGIAAIALGGGYAWLALASEPRVMRMTPAFELEQVARLKRPGVRARLRGRSRVGQRAGG